MAANGIFVVVILARIFVLLSFFGSLLFGTLDPAAAQGSSVATIAGTGLAGYQDGAALTSATFLFPSGVAVDAQGNLYVVDTAAQRVRVITRSGLVRTLAGSGNASVFGLWVPGAWRDGLGSAARFDAPTGIAVRGDKIYVADTGSSVIRLLTRDGRVSTYAGTPFKTGSEDGPRSVALFVQPTGLAIDSHGSLFVADFENGIRKIDVQGMVSTLHLAVKPERPLGIAINEDRHGETLFVADARLGILRIQPSGEISSVRPQDVQGGTPVGYASSLTAVDDHSVIYGDPRTHTIRYLDLKNNYTRVLAGQDSESAPETSGAFQDGNASNSFFDAPTGVLYQNQSIIVADSGNKRIRRISGVDFRTVVRISDQALPSCTSQNARARAAYVGNSYIYWDTDWRSSIPGQIERSLNRPHNTGRTGIRFDALQLIDANLSAAADYLEVLAESRCYNTVVFAVNSVSLKGISIVNFQNGLVEPTVEVFKRIGRAYAQAGVRLLIVVVPTHLELGPAEGTWSKIAEGALTPIDASEQWRRAMRLSGLEYVDMWPSFISDLKSPGHRALYNSADNHLTPHARALVAAAVTLHLSNQH